MSDRTRSTGPAAIVAPYEHVVVGTPNFWANTVMSSNSTTITDVVTPNYSRRQKNGEIINNPCSIVKESTFSTPGNYLAVRKSNPNVTYASNGIGSFSQYIKSIRGVASATSDIDVNDLVAEAKQKALAQIDSTPYSLAESVGEIRETILLLRNPLLTLSEVSRAFNKLKRRKYRLNRRATIGGPGNLRGIRDVRLQAVNDAYLEYQFAIKPLVLTVSDIVDGIMTDTHRPPRRTARGFAKGDDDVSESWTTFDFYGNRSASTRAEVRAGILYEVSNPINNIQFKYGLRGKDIPRTLWDLFPYSFMIDRVSHIGNAISGFVNITDPSVSILAAWVTTKKTRSEYFSVHGQSSTTYDTSVSNAYHTSDRFEYDRVPWTPTYLDALPRANVRGLVRDAQSITQLISLILKNLKA